MLMDPHPSQLYAGLQHAVWQPQQEVTIRKARYKPTEQFFKSLTVQLTDCPDKTPDHLLLKCSITKIIKHLHTNLVFLSCRNAHSPVICVCTFYPLHLVTCLRWKSDKFSFSFPHWSCDNIFVGTAAGDENKQIYKTTVLITDVIISK